MNKQHLFLFVFLLTFSFYVEAAESTNTSFFQGLWDFIDWVYSVFKDLKNSIFDFFMELPQMIFFWYIKFKISTVTFIWSVVEPIIDSLNLSDAVNAALSGLQPDFKAFISQIKLVEGINILITAKVTRLVLKMIGW